MNNERQEYILDSIFERETSSFRKKDKRKNN